MMWLDTTIDVLVRTLKITLQLDRFIFIIYIDYFFAKKEFIKWCSVR